MERALTYSPTFIARGIWGYFWTNLLLEDFATIPPEDRYLEERLGGWADARAQSIEQFTRRMALATRLPPVSVITTTRSGSVKAAVS